MKKILNVHHGFYQTPIAKAIGALLSMVVVAGLAVGCATGVTHYQRSYDVTVQFEKGIALPDHRYYAGGPTSKPNAVVAIQQDYRLESEHWTEVKATPETLKALVERVGQVDGAEYKERQSMHNGARLYAPDGRQIGVWYSVYDYSQVKFIDDRTIYLSYPPSHLPPNLRIPRFEGVSPWPH